MFKLSLLLTLTICAAASLAIFQPAYAQISEFKLTATDGAVNDRFGISVSISGDYAVVGAYLDDDNGGDAGSAYVLKRDGTSWVQEAKLLPLDGAGGDDFGWSVSISGDYAVVGALFDADNGANSGSAYVFKRTGTSWAQEAKLLPSDGAAADHFGYSVSISGDYAVVGARFDDDNGTDAGSAYVFKRTGTSWVEEAKLLPSDGAADDRFGRSVSISGDYAVVGAYLDDDNGTDVGSAYVFKRTGTSWAQEAKLLASDGEADDRFGRSVSISDDYAVVGADFDDDNGTNAGSAYLFKRTGTSWAQEAKLLASDGAADDRFGFSVSISGGYAVVGADLDDDNGANAGSAYLFKRTGTSWAQEEKLLASEGAASDRFGFSVSISGGYAIAGAWGDDDNGTETGSAYVYSGFIPQTDNAFDLDASTLLFSPNGSDGYDVSTISFSFDVALGTDVGAGDDTNHEVNFGSGFTFPYFGTTWSSIWVRSNGNVTFGGIGNADFFVPGDFGLVLPMIAALFGDLDPSAGGAVFYKDEAGKATVTWNNIPEYDVSNSNTIQLVLFTDGSFQITYNGVDIVTPSNGSLLVGFNSGRANPLTQSVDFTNVPINGGSNDVLFEFFGPPAPTISLSPDPLNFGDVNSGDLLSMQLSITNSFSAPLDVTNITVSNSDFSVASPTSFQVPAGSTLNKTISFNPASTGVKSATLTVTSNALNLPTATIALGGIGITPPVYPQISEFKITASDAVTSDFFGFSVSISGDYAVVGAYQDDDFGTNSGSAYVYKRTGTSWVEEAKLLPSDGAASDQFGWSVSISGDYAVVGALFDDDNGANSGSAYVFKRTGTSWAQEAKLLASDGEADDRFGNSVSISGDYAVMGAFGHDGNEVDVGSAFVFKRTGTSWAQEAELLASDGAASDNFGISVSISGDYAVVGAFLDDDNGSGSGSAYLFKRTGTSWAQEDKLLASVGAAIDNFGYSVSISGDYAVVGARFDDDNGNSSGSAYLFKRTGTSWAQEDKLLPADGSADDQFGWSVSISGDYAVVGARLDDDEGSNSGSAYLFKRTGTSWTQEAKLLASDGAANDWFGYSVSISGDNLIVGALLDDDNAANSGSAYNYSGSALNLPSISLSPDPLNFGDVNSGDSLKIQLSISNDGNAALDVTNITVSNSDFSVASPTSFQVSAGSTLNKTISFNPTSAGVKSATLTVTNNSSNQQTAIIALGGIGITPPVYDNIGEFKITASDGAADDQFGYSVSISGDYAVVGAYLEDDNGTDAGSAYVFKRNGTSWVEEAKLLPNDGAATDRFGFSVSISGDYAVVGAFEDDDNGFESGSAYVFKRTGTSWAQEAKLLPSDGAAGDFFGFSVFISGDFAVVGAILDDDNVVDAGSAYLFQRTGTSWEEEAKLLASDGLAGDQFGISVSISGDYAVVGSNLDDDNGDASGSAYLFKRSGTSWAQEAKLLPADNVAGDQFGISVSISGDYVVVGALWDDDKGLNSGSAYAFKRTGTSWAQEAKLLASDGLGGDNFGISVSISGDYAVVGAYLDDDDGNSSGSAYLFKRTGTIWAQEAKLLASDGAADDQFGYSVSISGDNLIVGAHLDDDNGPNSGSAFIYSGSATPSISLSPDPLNFGDVNSGNSLKMQLSISNDGNATLDVTNITVSNSDFSLSSPTNFQVPAGDSSSVTVSFNPSSTGAKSATLTVTSDASNLPTATVGLGGIGITRPVYDNIGEFKITASDAATSDNFGISVSISGDYAVVGAYLNDDDGTNSGSAYTFKRTGTSWVQEANLIPTGGAADDQFGYSVSISGDYAVAGAYLDDDNGTNSGSAYAFKRTGTSWAQEAKLLPSDGAAFDNFGWSVSISGDYAVVGAYLDDDNGPDAGSAYVFKRTGASWAQEAKLLPSDAAASDNFGISVSISGDYVVVGARFDDDNGADVGSAYLFKRNGTSWAQEAKLLASDGAAFDNFGWSVSISGDYAVVGAHFDDDNGADAGSAYVFKRNGTSWAQEAKLLASDGEADDRFGNSVSISGDYAVIGAFGHDGNEIDAGSAFVFKRTGTSWTQEAELLASDGSTDDRFGNSVSISGDNLIVGALLDDDNGSGSGSAYIYSGSAPASISLSPDPLNFGDVNSGDLLSMQLSITNSGGAALDVTNITVSNSDFLILSPTNFQVPAGDSSSVTVSFNPSSTGAKSATLTVTSDASNLPTATVPLGGIGITPPVYDNIGEFKITASDGEADDLFGRTVSISGDYAVVGALWDDDNGTNSGSAYVYKRTGTSWVEEAKLLPSDGAAGDQFGYSVSISGDYAVVGALWDDDNGTNSGSAYVFKRNGASWTQEAKLLPSDAAADDEFGISVSISGDYAVVGAWLDDDNGADAGSAYLFKRNGTSWAQEAKLLASDGASNDNFGTSVSVSGDYAVVGARFDDDNGTDAGSAYVFKRTGTSWAQEAKLLPSDGAADDNFGFSVSISGDYAVVGAHFDDDNEADAGSAYVFKRTGTSWAQEAKLLASDGEADDRFGNSVSISGDYVVVGARFDDDNGADAGSAYLFKRNGTSWAQEAKLLASDGAAGDWFGHSVSISGDYTIAGAFTDDDNGADAGSAYIYSGSVLNLPSISLSPDPLNFGDVNSGDSLKMQLSITNSGDAALDVTNITISNSGFSVASPASFQVSAGSTLNKTISFNPTSTGVKSATLTITSNASNLPSAPVALGGIGITPPVYAEIDEFKITAADGAAGDFFGGSVSISGDYAVVGALGDDDNGIDAGSAYVFRRSGTSWAQEAKLLASDGTAGDYYGVSVSISGDYAIVGADFRDDNGTNSGSAYVFKRTGTSWAQEAKLLPSDGAASDNFGWSVAISGDYAVVGAYLDDDNATDAGSAYLFKRTGTSWAQEAKLLASDGAANDWFGRSVSISGDYVVVGSQLDDDNATDAGSAYVFKRSGTSWAEEAKLLSSEGEIGDNFGGSVSISGDYAVVGARLDDDNGTDAGSAFVFKRSGTSWAQEAKLLPPDGAADDRFGTSISISGSYAIVGARGDDDDGDNSGSAFVFRRSGTSWEQETQLLSSEGEIGDNFGISVSISGSYSIVGAFLDDDNETDAGSSYIYSGSEGDVTGPLLTIPNPPNNTTKGQSIAISVTATDDSGVDHVDLKYRKGGESIKSVSMTFTGGSNYQASIPGSDVTVAGLSWWAVAVDGVGNADSTNILTIDVAFTSNDLTTSAVQGSAYPSGFPSGAWRIISVPANLTNKSITSVLSELGDSGPTTWRLWRWVNGAFSESTGSFSAGNAFWLQQRVQNQITIKPGSGTTTSNEDFSITLLPEWNLIGNPFAYPVVWSNTNTNISRPRTYTNINGGQGYLPEQDYIQPWAGYWVRNNSLTNQTLIIKPILHTGSTRILGKEVQFDPLVNNFSKKIHEVEGWFVNLSLTSKGYGDQFNYIGAVENAEDGYDRYDSHELPRMGDYVNLYFPHKDWGKNSSNYTTDMRSVQLEGYAWDFEVKTNLFREEMQIAVQNIEMAPSDMEVVLIDIDYRIAQDIRKSSLYSFISGTNEDPKHFKLLIGKSRFIDENNDGITVIPKTFSLSQNFPNPFNATTTFTYSLPEASHVNLQIYNILGQHVVTLVNEQTDAGTHVVSWNAGGTASGIYFSRIRAGNYHEVKKMLLIK